MKRIHIPIAISFLLFCTATLVADEITLYNSEGEATAYIATSSDLTIYLWDGTPVAYLDAESVFRYNGKHLGWFEDGIIWDHEGFAVGCVKNVINMIYQLQPLKSLKQLKPLKSLKQLRPLKPIMKNQWSSYSLFEFLGEGS